MTSEWPVPWAADLHKWEARNSSCEADKKQVAARVARWLSRSLAQETSGRANEQREEKCRRDDGAQITRSSCATRKDAAQLVAISRLFAFEMKRRRRRRHAERSADWQPQTGDVTARRSPLLPAAASRHDDEVAVLFSTKATPRLLFARIR